MGLNIVSDEQLLAGTASISFTVLAIAGSGSRGNESFASIVETSRRLVLVIPPLACRRCLAASVCAVPVGDVEPRSASCHFDRFAVAKSYRSRLVTH